MFLPCVFAGSGVSATPQRLWPAAPWTRTVQGQGEGKHLMYVVDVQPGHHRHGHPLDHMREVRGLYVLRDETVGELEEEA